MVHFHSFVVDQHPVAIRSIVFVKWQFQNVMGCAINYLEVAFLQMKQRSNTILHYENVVASEGVIT